MVTRTDPAFNADSLKEKLELSILKNKYNQVNGFSLGGAFSPGDEVEKFFLGLPQMLLTQKVRIVVDPSFKSLLLYDPQFMVQSMIKLGIEDPQVAREIKIIMKKHGFSIFKTEDHKNKILGCKIVA